jgi:putative acetyltransferase
MKRFDVRRAVTADAAILCDLHKASVRALCAGAYSSAQIELWLALRSADDYRRAMTSGEVMLAATYADRVVGFASTKGAELRALYVNPKLGRGAGGALLAAAEEQARAAGEPVLHVRATPNAVAFYRKHGYMRAARGIVRRGGVELQVLCMHKSLQAAGAPSTITRSVSAAARRNTDAAWYSDE